MNDIQCPKKIAAVIDAAFRYRDAMRQYIAEQAMRIDHGATLDDLMATTSDCYRITAHAEEELFALLDALDTSYQG